MYQNLKDRKMLGNSLWKLHLNLIQLMQSQRQSKNTDKAENTHCESSASVDGIWEEWTEWAACSVTCNNGTQVRNRTCTGPFHGGEPCPGAADEVKDCFPVHCPGKRRPIKRF